MVFADFQDRDGKWVRSFKYKGKQFLTESGRYWDAITQRSAQGGSLQKQTPAYIGTENHFKNFEEFVEWARWQVGYGNYWDIDKDILGCGRKVYSPTTCVFVPNCLNNFLTARKSQRGQCPIGVHFRKDTNKYVAMCNDGTGKQVFLGNYTTPEDAFFAYKAYKESLARALAEKWCGLVDERVCSALLNFTVNIGD